MLPKAHFAKNPYEAATKADGLALLTEWPEFKTLDFPRIKKLMLTPLLSCGSDDPDSSMNPASDPGVVVTTAGPVKGSATALMRSFLGIPYAAPPQGALRWKPPTAPAKFR